MGSQKKRQQRSKRVQAGRMRSRYSSPAPVCFAEMGAQFSDPELQAEFDAMLPEERCYFLHLMFEAGMIAGVRGQLEDGTELYTVGAVPPGGRWPG